MKAVSASAFVDRLKDNAKAAKAGAGAREVMKNPDSVRSPTQSAVASDDDAAATGPAELAERFFEPGKARGKTQGGAPKRGETTRKI